MFIVIVLYTPEDAASLEEKYPDHMKVAQPLIDAASCVYAGPWGGETGDKKVTRGVVFVFDSKEEWEKVASSTEGAAAIKDAQRIAGPGGMSVIAGGIEVSK